MPRALTLLGTVGLRFDAVVVSCRLPGRRPRGVGCVELAHVMFQRWPWIPVVLIGSAKEAERLGAEVLLTGVRDFVRTPVARADLVHAIQRVTRHNGEPIRRTPANIATIKRISGFLNDHLEDVPTFGELAQSVPAASRDLAPGVPDEVCPCLRQRARSARLLPSPLARRVAAGGDDRGVRALASLLRNPQGPEVVAMSTRASWDSWQEIRRLFPQPTRTRSGVEYVPLPYRSGQGGKGSKRN